MIVKCPRCGNTMETTGNPSRPFCSERCKLIDLGNWITGSYRIPEVESETTEEDESGIRKDASKE